MFSSVGSTSAHNAHCHVAQAVPSAQPLFILQCLGVLCDKSDRAGVGIRIISPQAKTLSVQSLRILADCDEEAAGAALIVGLRNCLLHDAVHLQIEGNQTCQHVITGCPQHLILHKEVQSLLALFFKPSFFSLAEEVETELRQLAYIGSIEPEVTAITSCFQSSSILG